MKPSRLRPSTALAGLILTLSVTAGCRNETQVEGPDTKLLQPPTSATPAGPSLFPHKIGNELSYSVRIKGKPARIERVRIAGLQRVGDVTGTLIEAREGAKVSYREVYQANDQGVSLLVGGQRGEMTFLPPLPVLRYPIRNGDSYAWHGKVRIGARELPGQAALRLSTQEEVKTPAGEFTAYRQDIALSIAGGSQTVQLLTQRWLVPQVGVVRSRHYDGVTQVEKVLLRFSRD